MMSSILQRKSKNEYTYKMVNNNFIPKLKMENSIHYPFNNENDSERINTYNENNKFKKLNFLFPSKSIDVRNDKFNYLYLQKIQGILNNNNNISIEEGIEKLKQLSISEKDKNKNNLNTKIYTSKNIINSKFKTKLNIYKQKRNYSSLINSNKNNNNNKCLINLNNEINKNENKFGAKNNSINELKFIQKKESGIKDQTKSDIKIVDILAQEIVQSKNEEELKEYLFEQLLLLDIKKRNEQNINILNDSINQLDKDKRDLRKCNTIVSQSLNKKLVENHKIDLRIKKLEEDIDKVKGNIKYYEALGDFYISQIKNLNKVQF